MARGSAARSRGPPFRAFLRAAPPRFRPAERPPGAFRPRNLATIPRQPRGTMTTQS